ncbi:MAG TPA: preprotein translocase subunit SecE [Chloroflexota bacterium]|jgi:preprotein translocase subunit SecE|nr:preprotein translocase subunit SecE [Chloroflexota bacterium]
MASRYGRTPPAPSRFGRLPGVGAIQRATDRESGIQRFYRDTRSELRKVVWPTREQATNLTILVVVASVAVGAILGGFDLLFAQLFKMLLGQG